MFTVIDILKLHIVGVSLVSQVSSNRKRGKGFKSCRRDLDRIGGKISSPQGLLSIGTGLFHPWICLKDV